MVCNSKCYILLLMIPKKKEKRETERKGGRKDKEKLARVRGSMSGGIKEGRPSGLIINFIV